MADAGKKLSRQQRRQLNKQAREQERIDSIRAEVERENSENPPVDQGAVESEAMQRLCNELQVEVHEITPDGHCLYNAIADQMNLRYPAPELYTYAMLRKAAANYMRQHADEFMPFISDYDEQAAGVPGQTDNGAQAPLSKYLAYCDAMETSAAWGGQPEILALSKVLFTPIHIVQVGMPIVKIGDDEFRERSPLLISYHVKMYGLGEVCTHS
ncbi:ubiquitinyl hydrolase 1 [Malassezia equina]|uniref:Ubiquitinyl hydrolase 1 n=1 Tax=Malassezia equina TaxID=1381935 RepID=A0AAF0EF56_9BASI|nr:ubiquitinyl hydrolase 1 [Malassezia equina]